MAVRRGATAAPFPAKRRVLAFSRAATGRPGRAPDEPIYCFAPVSDAGDEPAQIRILVEGFAFAIPTALVALDRADGLAVCDSLNRPLGWTRPTWTAFAARCLRAAGAGSATLH